MVYLNVCFVTFPKIKLYIMLICVRLAGLFLAMGREVDRRLSDR